MKLKKIANTRYYKDYEFNEYYNYLEKILTKS